MYPKIVKCDEIPPEDHLCCYKIIITLPKVEPLNLRKNGRSRDDRGLLFVDHTIT